MYKRQHWLWFREAYIYIFSVETIVIKSNGKAAIYYSGVLAITTGHQQQLQQSVQKHSKRSQISVSFTFLQSIHLYKQFLKVISLSEFFEGTNGNVYKSSGL